MNASPPQMIDCRIVGGESLPADSGGPDALCAAIREAAAQQAPGRRFSVEVRVLGPSVLAATVTTANGARLPEQKMAVSDRQLNTGSIDRFAMALAAQVARAEAAPDAP